MDSVARRSGDLPVLDDAGLVSLVACGDAQALAELYDRHGPVMRAVCRRITGNATEAEDLVHDVFLEAWRHAAEYDATRASVRTWLLLRTRSRALDRRKSAAATRTVPMGDFTEHSGDTPDASLLPDQARVRRVLGSLPEDQQRVLWLGYFEGLSSSEIAARVGIPVGTVKSRVAAALSRLRTALGEADS